MNETVPKDAPMFMTDEALKQLTGYSRPSAQIRWLAQRRYKYDVRADGRPIVLNAEILSRLTASPRMKVVLPDLDKVM